MADQANLFGNGNPTAPAQEATPQQEQQTVPNEPAQQQQQPAQQASQPAQPQLPPEVMEFVGEGKKYATVEAALASVPHAQSHISQLEQEKQQLMQQLEELQGKAQQAATVDDLMAKITASQEPAQADQPVQTSGLDEQAVLELLEKREAAKRAQQNQEMVSQQLINKYGDATKATEALKAKAQELEVDFGYFQELASRSPKAVLSYFGEMSKPHNDKVVPTSNSVSTAQYQSNQQDEYDCSYSHMGATTEDLVRAMRNAGLKVTGGQEINHYL